MRNPTLNVPRPAVPARTLFAALVATLAATLSLPADVSTWTSQYKIRPWETSKLTDADVVGPDGIVYPNLTGVGIPGGIPAINPASPPAGYTLYNVTSATYGADGTDDINDDQAVADALADALANAASGGKSILYFPAGTYYLTAPLIINKNNVVVAGDSKTTTILKLGEGSTSTDALFTFTREDGTASDFTPWGGTYLYATSNIARGSNTVVLDKDPATNGYAVGTWIRIVATSANAGSTMRTRYSKPEVFIDYTDPLYHFGRYFIAKITAIDSANKTITLDRSFPHDYFTDESPQLRKGGMLEYSGVQDLKVETLSSAVTVNVLKFTQTANCWVKGLHVYKPKNHPIILDSFVRSEIRDTHFDGTWASINSGSNAYLPPGTMDSLMDNCQANDLRHMGILQHAMRTVIRNCSFTGEHIQSPQLHGRFPLDNLIETTTFEFNTPRGKTFWASDFSSTLRHGPNGPRNVLYNCYFGSGAASAQFGGATENTILVYNKILKNNDDERFPTFWVTDRSFDTIIRGNVFQALTSNPLINMEDPTCTGWDVSDNPFYGTNRALWAGDSDPTLDSNNRFYPATDTPTNTTPEVTSLYQWQRDNAATPRLVVVIDKKAISENSGTTTAKVVRVKTSTASPLTVNLASNNAGATVPASVTIPAGAASADFTITGNPVSGGEQTATLTATASGLLSDTEKVFVLDANVTQPDFGLGKYSTVASGLPADWRTADFGRFTTPGSVTYDTPTSTWTVKGAGLEAFTYDSTLARAGRRFVYKTVSGDGEIIARVTSLTSEKQVGLMIADDEATVTEFFWVSPDGRVMGSGYDIGSHAHPIEFAAAGTKTVPIWLRLKRTGSVFTAYKSTVANPASEADWTQLASIDFYQNNTGTDPDYKSRSTLDAVMHFGMFINSGSETTLATATFTNVTITGTIVPPDLGLPAPSNLTATTASSSQINLTWTDSCTEESGFKIERRQGASGSWSEIAIVGPNVTSYSSTGLSDGVAYSYRLRTYKDNSYSPYSDTATATTTLATGPPRPPRPPPPPPVHLRNQRELDRQRLQRKRLQSRTQHHLRLRLHRSRLPRRKLHHLHRHRPLRRHHLLLPHQSHQHHRLLHLLPRNQRRHPPQSPPPPQRPPKPRPNPPPPPGRQLLR